MSETNMKISRKADGWWVLDLPSDPDGEGCGPYATRAAAAWA